MVSMRFDFRDIFKSARVAFSFQRLWIQFFGLSFGYLGYVIFTYLGLILSGKSFSVIWSRFGLFPTVAGYPLHWMSWILFGVGCFIFIFAWLVASTGVARAAYMHLKGNTFYTWKEAIAFALKKKGGSVISTPIAILLIAVFTGLGGVVVGLLGRIPVVGELGISLFAIIWFLAALFLVFVILALFVSILLGPSIIATTDDDAFEGIFQSFSTLFSFPWRLLIYEVLLVIIALLGFGVFALFAKKAWAMMTTLLVWGMGDKYADLSYAASYFLQNCIYPAVAWSRAILGDISYVLFFTRDFTAIELPALMTISAYIFTFFLLIIGGFIVSYPLAVLNAGNCIIFLVMKKKKDDENLLERKDREEEVEEEELESELEEPAEETKETPETKKVKTRGKKRKDPKE